jgi:hypothetical protein
MKSKLTVPKRNPFVCLVLKKTGAGSHRKSNKALRRLNKIRDRGEAVSQRTFNPSSDSSNLSGPTILSY